MSSFWTAWNSLASSPTSEAAKEGVVAAGEQLASTFKQLSAQLSTISSQAGEQYAALTGEGGEVENYANQIAQLNGQIAASQGGGNQPTDLLDQRDSLASQVSNPDETAARAHAVAAARGQDLGTFTVSLISVAAAAAETTSPRVP